MALFSFSAVRDVYFGHVFQSVGFFKVVLITCTICTVFFLIVAALWGALSVLKDHLGIVAAVNVTTAIAWIFYFFALTHISPAVANTLYSGIGPIAIIALEAIGWRIVARGPVRRWEAIFFAGIALSLVLIGVGAVVGPLGGARCRYPVFRHRRGAGGARRRVPGYQHSLYAKAAWPGCWIGCDTGDPLHLDRRHRRHRGTLQCARYLDFSGNGARLAWVVRGAFDRLADLCFTARDRPVGAADGEYHSRARARRRFCNATARSPHPVFELLAVCIVAIRRLRRRGECGPRRGLSEVGLGASIR